MASLSLRIYQKINPNAEFSVLLENKKSKESLLFQAGTVSSLSQNETDTVRANHYGRLTDSYGCLGVLHVCTREHAQLYLMVVTRCIKICNIQNSAICKIQEVDIISLHAMRPQNQKPQDEEPWMRELKKLVGNESFYFSVPLSGNDEPFDITLCAQRRAKLAATDNRFFWNRILHLHPKRFGIDAKKWLIKVMVGSIEFSTLYMNNHTPKILIISRLSCERAGTRFNVRGVNDAGNVANFVETEQLILVDSLDDLVLSYIQLRGTVPLFWEQPGLNVGSHKVKMSREPEVSVQAFRKHVRFLREKYGKQVVINLLGTGVTGKRQGEAALSHLFQFQHLNCQWTKNSPHIVFDFHQECRGGSAESLLLKLRPQICKEIEEFGFFCSRNEVVEKIQSGVMRTNCLDCLDRTNRVQSYLALDIMQKKLEIMGVSNNGVIVQRFTAKLEEMWKDNGNRISQNYAGTGALQGSKIIDGARSAARTIQNNLLDNSKQEAIDIMLHGNLLNNYLATLSRTLLPSNYLYAPIPVLKETCERSGEFSTPIPLRVAVGTYNVNGGKHFRSLAYKHLSLDDWLLDSQKNEGKNLLIDTSPSDDIDCQPPDIFAIGFEEIVDLTAQNIVQNTQSSENATSWGRELKKLQDQGTPQTLRENSFGNRGPRLFNVLPADIRNLVGVSEDTFKNKLDKWLTTIPDERKEDSNSLIHQEKSRDETGGDSLSTRNGDLVSIPNSTSIQVISRDEKYVMVTWKQLVGVALFVFVHERHAGFIRDVCVETVKTGMQGATGNKGGVGIRMVIRNTSMAFVCSHFAAGQKEVNERNSDYDSIARKLVFNLGIPLWAHDYVFWCGDFNYRISLPRDEVVDLIQRQEWGLLQEQDQLKNSQRDGKCFKGFIEGDINFPPTYKYDLFSDDYDTSEKLRIPAWTDRVLFWRRQYPKDKNNPEWSPGKIIHYGRAELKQSDHRPVLAIIEVEGRTVVESKRAEVYQSVVESLGPTDCTVVLKAKNLPTGENPSDLFTGELVQEIGNRMLEYGTVVLYRPVDDCILYTFSSTEMALKATEGSPLELNNLSFEISLKTVDWRQQLQEELTLCGDNTIPLKEENLDLEDQADAVLSLEHVEGVLDELYQDEEQEEEFDAPEILHPEPIKPARPAPPRPPPSRPPPPMHTPPGSGPGSPSQVRSSEKSDTFEKPPRPQNLFNSNDSSPEEWPKQTQRNLLSTNSTPTPPPLQPPPPVPSRTPSLESPCLGRNLHNGADAEPPSPNHFRPISRDDSFPSPPLDSPPEPPTSMPPPESTPPLIPPPSLPSLMPVRAPPSLPPRSPSHAPTTVPPQRTNPPPPFPNRTLPPVPSRNLPPVPPRK